MTEQEYQHHLPIGAILGEYKIEKILGEGGFGVTYLVTDQNIGRQFAIKEYLPGDMAIRSNDATVGPRSERCKDDFQWGLERFLEEAKTLASFHHPNLNQVLRFFEANGTAYMVLEYIEGETLTDILKKKKTLPEAELENMLTKLLSGLAVVHDKKYTHRDIKPGNIMIKPDGTPVLLDFGAARQALGNKSEYITTILTPGYAPIEQYDTKGADIGPWTDLYSLGMVAYCCISGKKTNELPESPSRASMIRKGKTEQDLPKALVLGKGEYAETLLKAVDWTISVFEEDRPQNVAELQGALGDNSQPPPLEPDPPPNGIRRRYVVIPLLLFIGVAILITLVKMNSSSQEDTTPPSEVNTVIRTKGSETITTLLEQCSAYEDDKKYLSPAEVNAYSCYQKVLRFDTNNAKAKAGIQGLIKIYLGKGQESLKQDQLASAKDSLRELRSIAGSETAIAILQQAIASYEREAEPVTREEEGLNDFLESIL